eukprot:5121189-Pyramimonas_sp.AAC.1
MRQCHDRLEITSGSGVFWYLPDGGSSGNNHGTLHDDIGVRADSQAGGTASNGSARHRLQLQSRHS